MLLNVAVNFNIMQGIAQIDNLVLFFCQMSFGQSVLCFSCKAVANAKIQMNRKEKKHVKYSRSPLPPPPLSLSLYLSIYLSISLSLSFSVFLSLSLSLSLSLYFLSLSHTLSLSLSLSLSRSCKWTPEIPEMPTTFVTCTSIQTSKSALQSRLSSLKLHTSF